MNLRAADLSHIQALVPLRTLEGGKARLGGALDAEEREELIVGMLRLLLRELAAWGGAEAVLVVSPDRELLAVAAREGARPVVEATPGLNDGLRTGRAAAMERGATALLVLPADLPLVTAAAIGGFVEAADAAIAAGSAAPVVAIAPADARSGTNALLLSPPDLIDFAFGEASFDAHLRAAEAAGAAVQVVIDPALGFDLDTPDDLARLEPERLSDLQALGGGALERTGPGGRAGATP